MTCRPDYDSKLEPCEHIKLSDEFIKFLCDYIEYAPGLTAMDMIMPDCIKDAIKAYNDGDYSHEDFM